MHSNDDWWQVQTTDGTARLIDSPAGEAGQPLDVEDPQIDPSGNYIVFRNMTDQTLWVLTIAQ